MDYTIIIAAVIAATPPTLVALRANKLSKKSHAILQGNGKGAVDKMLEDVLKWQSTHAEEDEARFTRLERAVKNSARRSSRRG